MPSPTASPVITSLNNIPVKNKMQKLISGETFSDN